MIQLRSPSKVRMAFLLGGAILLPFGNLPRVCFGTQLPQVADGERAFQAHRWLDALAFFVEALRQDPTNAEAHKYIPLTIREIQARNDVVVRDERLAILSDASRRLEHNDKDSRQIDAAVADMTHSEERSHEERWTRWVEEAKVERQMGHLLAA